MTGLSSAIVAVSLTFCAAGPEGMPPKAGGPPPKPGAQPAKAAAEPVKAPIKQEWTHEQLRKLGGQPLGRELTKLGDEAYFFAFTSPGITSSTSVLIYRKGSEYFLKTAEVHLHDYYGSGGKNGIERKERKLTADEWNGVQAKLKQLDYWNFQQEVAPAALDGTFWTLDGAMGEKFRSVTELAPDAGKFRAAALHVWRLSGAFMGNWAEVKQ